MRSYHPRNGIKKCHAFTECDYLNIIWYEWFRLWRERYKYLFLIRFIGHGGVMWIPLKLIGILKIIFRYFCKHKLHTWWGNSTKNQVKQRKFPRPSIVTSLGIFFSYLENWCRLANLFHSEPEWTDLLKTDVRVFQSDIVFFQSEPTFWRVMSVFFQRDPTF